MKILWKTFRQLLPLLPSKAQSFLWMYVVVSSALAILDIGALMLLALSLTSMLQNRPVHIPLIGTVDSDGYVWIIAAVSVLILAKSVLAIALQWFATRRFATYELEIGHRLFDAYIKAPWTERLKRNTAQLVRLADVGIANATSGFLLPLIGLPTLATTFVAILVVVVVAQPLTALITVVYLGLIMALLYSKVSRKSVEAGRVARDYSFKVASLMTDMVAALKEITLRNMTADVARVVQQNRTHTTRARANINFLGALPKFVLDAALVGGFILVGGFGYVTGGLSAALAGVALFGVAGFRLVPSLTGFQSIITTTTANVAHVQAVISDIHAAQGYLEHAENIGHDPIVGTPRMLRLENVAFTYPNSRDEAVHDINLELPFGSTLALVGASGAGKSTLVDILLGLLVPSRGTITLDGQNLEDVLAGWRSRVGYVPQDVSLFDGTVAQNVALAWSDDIDLKRVTSALERAQLLDVILERPGGLQSRIGDRGLALSGGQRQRLGIARALYDNPLVLVMDEATSALDTKTESLVAAAIRGLRGEVTIVSVAHRLSTVRDNDLVCFMQEGTIAARGTFDELVAAVPNFAEQAALAGLA